MNDVPKYREHGVSRAIRLDLGKPHIFWDGFLKEWLADTWNCEESQRKAAINFVSEQDKRWTPVQKD